MGVGLQVPELPEGQHAQVHRDYQVLDGSVSIPDVRALYGEWTGPSLEIGGQV